MQATTTNPGDDSSPVSINVSYLKEQDYQDLSRIANPSAEHVAFVFEFDSDNKLLMWNENCQALDITSPVKVVLCMGALAGHFRQLKSVRFESSTTPGQHSFAPPYLEDRDFPIVALSDLLRQNAQTLTSLQVRLRCALIGPEVNFACVLLDLQRLARLEKLDLYSHETYPASKWRGQSSREGTPRVLINFFHAYVLRPHLNTLRRVSLPSDMYISTFQFRLLLEECPNLVSFGQAEVCVTATEDNDDALAESLRQAIAQHTTLQSMDFYWIIGREERPRQSGSKAIAGMLHGLTGNSSLTALNIFLLGGFDTLDRATCFGGFADVMDQVLPTNCSIQQLDIFRLMGQRDCKEVLDDELSDACRFYLKANQKGRKILWDNLEDQRWRTSIVDNKDDTRFVFYLLSNNLNTYLPHLVNEGTATKAFAQAPKEAGDYAVTRMESRTTKRRLTVFVPAWVRPGDIFFAQDGNRRVRVKCPANSGRGQELLLTMPMEPTDQTPLLVERLWIAECRGVGEPVAQIAEPQFHLVTVPAGVYPGDKFTEDITGQRIKMACPPNAGPFSKINLTAEYTLTVHRRVHPNQNILLKIWGQEVHVKCPPNMWCSGQKYRICIPITQTMVKQMQEHGATENQQCQPLRKKQRVLP